VVPTKIKSKSLINKSVATEDDLALINKNTINPLSVEDVFVFKVKLCDNELDRVNDHMTDNFLNEFADKAKSLTGITNHDWDAEGQMSRLYDTEVVEEEGVTNKLGEPYKYVLGKAYTLNKFQDYIDKISSGLLKETSVSFESTEEVCSICGKQTLKGPDNVAVCPDGHVMGETYDGKLAYNDLKGVKDVFEWSLVAVPCQRDSGIVNKSYGGINLMKKGALFFNRWLKSKGLEAEASDVEKFKSDEDVTEDDIKEILAENDRLLDENKALKAELEGLKTQNKTEKIEAACKAYVESLNPLTPVVTENILGEIDRDKITLGEDGAIVDLEDLFKPVVEKYKGLFKEAEPTNDETKGCEEKTTEVVEEPKKEEVEVKKKAFNPHFSISNDTNGQKPASFKSKSFEIN
jgi:hypothetical protein